MSSEELHFYSNASRFSLLTIVASVHLISMKESTSDGAYIAFCLVPLRRQWTWLPI